VQGLWLEGIVRSFPLEVSTMFSNILNLLFRGKTRSGPARYRSAASPRLEELESRLAPFGLFQSYLNASVQIIPNLSSFTVTENVTATVVDYMGPLGVSPVPVTGGTVYFNLNNQLQQTQVDSNGQATATFKVPLFELFSTQLLTLQSYGGTSEAFPSYFRAYPSYFMAPLYRNFDNFLFPANVTFPWQNSGYFASDFRLPTNSANGETDNFGLFSFQYSDPGVITSMELFGRQLPGIFAAALGAYGWN
jgi:hypothetical protein